MRTKIKLSDLISRMLKIEYSTGIKLDSYYLYDRENKERITIENCYKYNDYAYIYHNCTRLDFSYDEELDKDPIKMLQKSKGCVYVPICLRNQQKAYVFKFNTDDLCRVFVNNGMVEKQEVYEQLCLPL